MKKILILSLWIAMLQLTASAQSLNTDGDYSPTVVAKNFTTIYGVRSDAVLAILDVYAKQGLPPQDRKARTEALIKDYKNAIPQVKGISQLTKDEQNSLGIAAEAGLVQALNWDMFARQYYLSTRGAYSPAIVAQGDVTIWYGIPEPALRTLAGRLEANKVELGEFGQQLSELAEKYEALKKEFETYGHSDLVVRKAEQLLEEGKLEDAEALLESDYHLSKKRLAYKAYLYGKTKELLLKYAEAAEGYRDAVLLEPQIIKYAFSLGNIQVILAHYVEATAIFENILNDGKIFDNLSKTQRATVYNNLGSICHSQGNYLKALQLFQKGLEIDTTIFEKQYPILPSILHNIAGAYVSLNEFEKGMNFFNEALRIDSILQLHSELNIAVIYSGIGYVWLKKGYYDLAIQYFERAVAIDSIRLGMRHPIMAAHFGNIGGAWNAKGEYDKAISYYEEALQIDTIVFGKYHPEVALCYNNLGLSWDNKEDISKAINFYELALDVNIITLGSRHPNVAMSFNNLGSCWASNRDYDKAINYYEQSLSINLESLGRISEEVAICLSNIGVAWKSKGDNRMAIKFHEESLGIDTTLFGLFHPNVAANYTNLGVVHDAIGDYEKAILFDNKALAIDTVLLGPIHPIVATQWSNLGLVWRKMHNFEKAIECFTKSLLIDSLSSRNELPSTADHLSFLGTTLILKGDLFRARTIFLEALRIDTMTYGWSHLNVGKDCKNLGTVLQLLGEFDDAISYFEKAIAIHIQFYPVNHAKPQAIFSAMSKSLFQQGLNMLSLSRSSQALTYFQKALQASESLLDKSYSVNCLAHIAATQNQLNNYPEAQKALEKGIQRADSLAAAYLQTEQSLPDSIKAKEKYWAERDSLLEKPILRQLHYQQIVCLAGLGRKKEAKAAAKTLITDALAAKDEIMIAALRKEGWLKE